LLCSVKGQKRREVCVPAFQRYSTFSGLIGKYSSFKGKKRREVCVCMFQRYSAFSVLVGPEETKGARSCVPEIFHIFCFDGEVL
ncbi:hypothetical protein K443DRAFT_100590, partial [Laccaria amethystina LaAM-08-1]